MNFTKEQISLLNHALDCMCRAETQGVASGGLPALKQTQKNAGMYIGARLTMAVELSVALDAEFTRLVQEEAAKAEGEAKAEKQE